jgi:membrane peptidoglycan carboxypeptidase
MPSTRFIRRKQQERRRGGSRVTSLVQLLLASLTLLGLFVGSVAAAGVLAFIGGYRYFAADLPTPEQFEELVLTSFQTTKIYDRTGQHLLYEVIDPKGGDRTVVPLQDIPLHMQNATIALEDKTFYTNPGGINFEGIFRAFWNNLRGERIQGGSSITAQLVRNVTMDPEERYTVSYARKIKEAILSVELTQRYPGREGREMLLEWYLNTVPFGNNATGVEAAAKVYFGKHAKDLTLAEAAMLANIPQYPAKNPIDSPEEAKARQGLALRAMVEEGYITAEEAEEAWRAELPPPPPREGINIQAPHFIMHLLRVMEERYGKRAVYGGGLQVISTLDLEMQNSVQELVTAHSRTWRAANAHNAAAVVIRPSTGEILAMVGSADYFDKSIDGEVNMAVAPRQPGSSIKPYTYAAAFEQGYNPGTMVEDKTTAFHVPFAAPYVPRNADGGTHGKMPLRRALACSYNIPAVILLDRIGIDSMLDLAHRIGINDLRSRESYGLAVTLGGGEISLLDHTYGFSVFANGGIMAGIPVPPQRREPGFRELDPMCILKVTDGRGRVLEEVNSPERRQVLTPQVAYQVCSVLSDNDARAPAFGAHNVLVLDRPVAAKTGTTNDYTDAWTMGFTPQLSVGVWVGNSDRTPMSGVWGVTGAGPLWRDIMKEVHKDLAPVDFLEPSGVRWVEIDAETGALPGPGSKNRTRDVLVEGWEPVSDKKQPMDIAICRASGKLATEHCPAGEVEHKRFDLYPTANGQWVRSITGAQPPTAHCDEHEPE